MFQLTNFYFSQHKERIGSSPVRWLSPHPHGRDFFLCVISAAQKDQSFILRVRKYELRVAEPFILCRTLVLIMTAAYGQPEKILISCGFTRLDLFTSTCFCLSWCVTASVISGANGFWLRSILNPPQRKLIEQKTE